MEYSKMSRDELINEIVSLQQRFEEELDKGQNSSDRCLSDKIFRLIIENADDLVSLHNPDDLRYLYINPAGLSLLGYSWEDLAGKEATDFIHADDLGRVLKVIEQGRDKGYGKVECRCRRKDGSYIWTSTAGKIINEDSDSPLVLLVKRDISRSKKAEQALKMSEARYRAVVEDQTELICRWLPDTRLIFVNEAYCKYFNKRKEEIIGKSFLSLVPEEEHESIRAFIASLKPEDPASTYTHKVIKSNGEIAWQEWTDRAIFNRENSLIEIQSVGRDISKRVKAEEELRNIHRELEERINERTAELIRVNEKLIAEIDERQQAEKALLKSEKQYRELFDNAKDIIYVHDLEGKLISLNKAGEKILGFKQEEIKGKSVFEIVNPEYRQLASDMIKKKTSENVATTYEIETIIRGKVVSFEVSSKLIYEKGKAIAVQAIARDISERKKMEDALRESEAQFRILAETNPAMIFLHDGKKFKYVNPSFERVSGFTYEECLNMDFWDIAHPDYRHLLKNHGHARMRGAEAPKQYEFKLLHKNGNEVWIDVFASRIEYQGEPGIIGTALDITDRKAAEERIKYLSFYDSLTGINNRVYFEEKLKELDTEENLPLSLIMGDINGLKLVNEALSYEKGDLLLKKLAKILKVSCRQGDIVARLGGDEFAIVLPRTDYTAAARICETIRSGCNQTDALPVQVSFSMGISSRKNLNQDINELIKEAEDRMCRNKLLESRSARSSIIISLEEALWTKSHETEAHCRRLREMAVRVGRAIGLSDSEQDNLILLAALHDIGKISIPNDILDRATSLYPEEWEIIKKHPETGYRIALSVPELTPIAEAILAHHERWDGKGYPLRLKGEDIPHISRIISVVDTYDVMVNGRPYRQGVSPQEALDEIRTCAGTQFDPELVDIFLEIMSIQ